MPFAPRLTAPLAALALLSACAESADAPGDDASIEAVTAADAPEGIGVTDARIVLPAVDGRPGVAYFTLTASGEDRPIVASVFVDNVGRAEIHRTVDTDGVKSMEPVETLAVPTDGELAFAPGGYHVMLFDIGPELVASGMAEMTISFANGDKASIAVPVEAAGGAMAMDMGGAEDGH